MHQNLLFILIHILKTPTQSFSSVPPGLGAGFFSPPLVVKSEQCPSVFLSTVETRTLYIKSPGKTFHIRLQSKKRGKKITFGTHSSR